MQGPPSGYTKHEKLVVPWPASKPARRLNFYIMLMKGRYQCFFLFPFLLKKIQVFNGYEYFFQKVKTILFVRDKSIALWRQWISRYLVIYSEDQKLKCWWLFNKLQQDKNWLGKQKPWPCFQLHKERDGIIRIAISAASLLCGR